MDYSRQPPKFKNCKRISYLCEICQRVSWDKPSSFNKKDHHFCSQRCYSIYRKDLLPKEKQHAYKNGGYPEEEKKLRIRARSTLNHAIRDGKIKKIPCEVCGEINSQAHHGDYGKPLEVKWLCVGCHWEEHKIIYENPETLAPPPIKREKI